MKFRSKTASAVLRHYVLNADFGAVAWSIFAPEFKNEICRRTYASGDRLAVQRADYKKLLEYIIYGSNKLRYEVAWTKEELDRNCPRVEAWSERWWRFAPEPRQIRALIGHSNQGICDEARGFELPDDFVETLRHGSRLSFCDSISSGGLVPGGLAAVAGRAHCCFSALD